MIKKKILLAEDNLINQKVALLMLKKFDQNIELADNGLIAVEKFKSEHYDVVLMDLHMPELDGFEATRKIREIENSEQRPVKVKIYAMTASSMQDEKDNCLNAGMDGYLAKPFRNDDVIALLAG
ncbi:MAG TPA: response regulator [Bacteroidales bacterium]|nr:response regulator [Bacteroidales bacterium]